MRRDSSTHISWLPGRSCGSELCRLKKGWALTRYCKWEAWFICSGASYRSLDCPVSADLQRILLGDRRHDAIQTQIDNELAVVVGDVPDGGDGDAEARVGPGVGTLDAVERVLRCDCGQDVVAVVE